MANKLKWDGNLPVQYWLNAALFQNYAAGVYIFWVDDPELTLCINCNDYFFPAADSEEVHPEDIEELLNLAKSSELKNQYNVFMGWIANKRGDENKHWKDKT